MLAGDGLEGAAIIRINALSLTCAIIFRLAVAGSEAV
ncbi:MAG: hypothetical protein JWP42_5070 [Pseudomonas sp.]|nr:hypothetical protein [Pseudomonas sp.]